MLNREEFVSGHNPTNALDYFALRLMATNAELLVLLDRVPIAGEAYAGLSRFYSLHYVTNMLEGAWIDVVDHTNLTAETSVVVLTNAVSPPALYRGKVWLVEE